LKSPDVVERHEARIFPYGSSAADSAIARCQPYPWLERRAEIFSLAHSGKARADNSAISTKPPAPSRAYSIPDDNVSRLAVRLAVLGASQHADQPPHRVVVHRRSLPRAPDEAPSQATGRRSSAPPSSRMRGSSGYASSNRPKSTTKSRSGASALMRPAAARGRHHHPAFRHELPGRERSPVRRAGLVGRLR